jgi:sortase A
MQARNHKQRRKFLRLEALLWAGGAYFATIYLYYWFDRNIAQLRYEQEMETRESQTATTTPTPTPEKLKAGDLLGEIEVPGSGIAAAIVEGDDEKTLQRAVGHLPGTALPGEKGRVALAGHRDTFFRGLRLVNENDRIRLTTPSKKTYEYRVEKTEIVKPSEVSVLAHTNESALTLITCYPFYYVGDAPLRYIVQARLVPAGENGESQVTENNDKVKQTAHRAPSRARKSIAKRRTRLPGA